MLGNSNIGVPRGALRQLELDLLVVEFAGVKLAPERLPRRRRGGRADQRVQQPLLGGKLRLGLDSLRFFALVSPMPTSTRSRTICSTSRPT